MAEAKLKPAREKSLRHRHPWVYSGAIERVTGAEPGAIVDVVDSRGNFLARGFAWRAPWEAKAAPAQDRRAVGCNRRSRIAPI